jgi:hypothetical protein
MRKFRHAELSSFCQKPNIEKILHATIEFAQFDHCLELLCNDCFSIVGAQNGRGMSKNCGIDDGCGFWSDDITKANIDLPRNDRVPKLCGECCPDTVIVGVLGNAFSDWVWWSSAVSSL